MTIDEMVKAAHENSKAKGWWDNCCVESGELLLDCVKVLVPEKLCLIHSEVSEALEDYREGAMMCMTSLETGKPTGFPSELADILIRVADLAGALCIDLEAEVKQKMAYNATRPHRHGGKRC